MELACSEGRFTELLAPRVGHLIAADISETALQRARQRCHAHGNVDWRRLDLFDDALPDGLDLIVCSEVLYDLADRDALARVAKRLAAALAPGGHLLSAHAFVLKDEPGHTGYDWDAAFGAKVIAESPGDHAGSRPRALLAERALPRRPVPPPRCPRAGARAAHRANRARPAAGAGLRPPCRLGRRRGAARRASARERSDRLPILLYHRIAEDGPGRPGALSPGAGGVRRADALAAPQRLSRRDIATTSPAISPPAGRSRDGRC